MKYALARDVQFEGEVIGESAQAPQRFITMKDCWMPIRAR